MPGPSGFIRQGSSANRTVSSVIGGGYALTKTGLGILVLSSASNSYTGPTTILGGILSVVSLGNVGVNSYLGSSSAAASNLLIDGGTLRFSNPSGSVSTNRAITIGAGGATLEKNGASGTQKIAASPVFSASATLTLAGSSTSLASFGSLSNVIADGAGGAVASVTKSGTGWWGLSSFSANTYTGPTLISGGVLIISSTAQPSNSSGITADGGEVCFAGTMSRPVAIQNTAGSSICASTNGTSTANGTISSTLTFGGSNSKIRFCTNGTTTVSTITQSTASQTVALNGVTVDCTAGQNLNAGTYTILTIAGTSTFTGTATAGLKPANCTTMTMQIVGQSLQIVVT